MRPLILVGTQLLASLSLLSQTFTGTNAPNVGTNFAVSVSAAATNLSFTVAGTALAYSYLLVRKGSAPTDTTYDFSSQVNGQTNAIHLEQPEASPGIYFVRVRTPAGSQTHAFTLLVESNRTDLRTAERPVTKALSSQGTGLATSGSRHYFRVELTTNTSWRVALDAAAQMPDLYVARGQLPSESSYLKRSINITNDLVAFAASDPAAGVASYFIGVFAASAPTGGVAYTLRMEPVVAQTLVWDPGTAHLGTQVYTNLSGLAEDYYFRITTANPALGAWRTALRLLTNDANLYLSRSVLPTPDVADFKSERNGSDGLILALSTQFLPNEEWYILVRAKPGAQWTLLSGSPFVTDLGVVAADDTSGSGGVEIGPEGMRFFSATAPAEMLAWRLWLNGASNSIFVKKTSLPLPGSYELLQAAQMLVVPSYLTVGQYFIGILGSPGTNINLDSRQQPIFDAAYDSSAGANVTGFGYTTYRVQVPPQQIAWQLYLPSTSGNPNLAVRRNTVPNENNNDAYSENIGSVVDNITLVPPVLSDGTFYITVYATGEHQFTLENRPAVVTDINYVSTIVNDDPARVGWRYYRVADIGQQLGSLGWDLFLTNFVPGTRIALRRNAAPSLWSYRNPTPNAANYYDLLSAADFLQHPAHQADVWYIGVYHPTNALGPFTLVTQELPSTPLTDNVSVTRSSVLSGRWEFFRIQLTPEDVQGSAGPGPVLGWDLRVINVSSGLPRLVVRREAYPASLNSTFSTLGANWPNGGQWAAAADWTRRALSAAGTNEDGRILAMGVGRPLEAGTYYIGVLNATGTNNMSYSVLSRWIGPGRAIPVQDLSWSGGLATNTIAPREAAYYRVTMPPNIPSWKVRLSTTSGEAMLVAVTNRVPNVDSEKRIQKFGKEHYLLLPPGGSDYVTPGTNFLTVVGEGINPADALRVGTNNSSYVLETLGSLPEPDLGFLSTNDIIVNDVLEGGESKAYHFHTVPTTLGFWIFLENKIGNPWAVSRGGMDLADPGLGVDTYGNEGGEMTGAVASPDLIVVADPFPDETIMVKGRQSAGVFPDANYTLRVKEILPESVTFDGGTYNIVNRPGNFASFFYIDVPPNAVGWDLRVLNVTSGSPQLVIMRDFLPITPTTIGFSPSPFSSSVWPIAARWAAGLDWTERAFGADGSSEVGRILAMGMGRPLQPGRYYVGVLGGTGGPVSCTLMSRGIGSGFSIPITDLSFAGGQVTVTNLAPREAAYYRVIIPTNTASWKVQLSASAGESLLIALKDVLPNVGATISSSAINNSGGRKMQKLGDEQFILLPAPGQSALAAGIYYLAVVSEGQSATNSARVGVGPVHYTLRSIGEAPVAFLGDIGSGELVESNYLAGGEVRIYQFSVPSGVQTMEARLENRTGNPTMTLRAGPRTPDPGAAGGLVVSDPYGNDGGESPGTDVNATLLNIANPTNGIYTLVVKARALSGIPGALSNATYTLRINASGTIPINFDQGTSSVVNQAPSTWRYFRVIVPTNALGWDIRLINVVSGLPRIVVRRETLPNAPLTMPWGAPGATANWPTNYQWAPGADWTRRSLSVDGLVNEDGRILAMGLNRPLEPGTYFIGIINFFSSANMSYTVLSRGMGSGFSIPILDLPFVGSVTNSSLPARDAAYYRIVVPSNAPSWKLSLSGITGESMLLALRNALPNIDSFNPGGTLANGKSMQKLGNEHFLFLPVSGQTNVLPGTNYLAVVSEGVNPGTAGRIGPGSSSYVLRSLGPTPVVDLGLLTSEDLLQPDVLQGGEVKAYQFTVPFGTYGAKIRLENRVNNPVMVALAGERLPDPSGAVGALPPDSYGTEGGYVASDGHPTIVTLPNPAAGTYSLMTKARQSGGGYPDASYTLRVQEILVPELNFSSDQNTNGLSHEVSGLLEDNERAFFKIWIPATNNGRPVIGWKLDLVQSSGLASMRVRRDLLPADANLTQMPFTSASAIIAPPYLTNGFWFVEVKGSGSTAFTLRSSPLNLERPAWVMPAPGEGSQTPGVTWPMFGDTAIDTNGIPLGGDQSIFLEQGFLHYYAVQVPATNHGLLRAQLEAISGNPDLYLRVAAVPTLHHNLTGGGGTIYDRSMLAAAGTEYANWVPLDGRLESQLKPGLWYLAVRAAGNANARYRLRLSVGGVTDLPIHSGTLSNQIVAGGDWRYYRIPIPTALPLGFNVTFSQQAGDVVMHLRDTVPPGNGLTMSDLKDWGFDQKNLGPYLSYDLPNTYSFAAPPVRPGQILYLGFRALSDSTFTIRVATNGAAAQEPNVVAFYGGTASATVQPFSQMFIRVDVPAEGTRWRHFATHPTNLVLYLDQGSVPTRTANRWMSSMANSTFTSSLVLWNTTLKQYVPNAWPWVPRQSYFLVVTNVTATPQDFTFFMDGRNALNEDEDLDGLLDAWEFLYFGSTGQSPTLDPDGDGVNNLNESTEGTDPTNPNSYRARLTVLAVNGTVSRQPDLSSYALGSTVILTPLPASGYAFIGWSGQADGLDNPLSLLMDAHKNITARFKLAGDDFITALPLSGTSATVSGSNVSTTKEPGEPNHAGNPGGKSIWWRWTAPGSGAVTISTAGSTFTTLLAVYTGPNVSNLVHIASDINSTGGTNRSRVSFNAIAGATYHIAVDGYNGASSRITLSLNSEIVVVRPQLAQPMRLPDGTAQFVLTGEPNRAYGIEFSEDLLSWNSLSSVTTSGSGTATFSDPMAVNSASRFYRAVAQ